MKREKGVMDMDTFRKIVDECVDIPVLDCFAITGLGETLLDPLLIERLKYAREKLGKLPLDIFTNGHGLTVDKIDELERAGLNRMYVSLNSTTRYGRKAIMGLDDYEEVEAVLKEAGQHRGNLSIIVCAVAEKSLLEPGESDRFNKLWGDTINNGGQAFLHLEGNWAGDLWPMRIVPKEACGRALSQIMILWNSDMVACCHDAEARLVFGNVKNNTIKEIYSNPVYVEFRKQHYENHRDQVEVCRGCTTI